LVQQEAKMDLPSMHYFPSVDDAAIAASLASWRAERPKMGVLALLPEAEKDNIKRLQSLCAQHQVVLVGAVFPALIERGEFRTQGVWLLRFDEMPDVALHENLPRDAAGAAHVAQQIGGWIRAQINGDEQVTLFLLFDALVPNISTLLDELYLQLANRVHYVGANAGSETFQPMPCLFDNTRTIQNGVLLMLLQPHLGAMLAHGYAAPPRMISATSTEGNRIRQIDWRPAFEVYQELVRTQSGVEVTRENFYQHAVHFPFGIIRANHEVLVRIPVALEEDGSLFCVGEVPANAVLTLLEAPKVDSQHTLQTLLKGLSQLHGDMQDSELLLFYCAGRRLHLGLEAATGELHQLAQRALAQQIAGALSLGEIGSSLQWGYPLFHNATLVAMRWNKG
ncbi:MAG TPA: FIST C-terminal domain-containing protein, partial [Steroidobacteraceae bacterium]|nr:FIST C-terminal domain-containing protein [Steroidobacteraceae bacterium]